MSESDFERIDLDTSLDEAHFNVHDEVQKPDFAQVIFHNIAEAYATDAHIVCDYTITPVLVLNEHDYVGLFRVGWKSARDYIDYQISPMPSIHRPGADIKNRVVFQEANLPKDDGEFYQFCYVTSTGGIRGASTPFQFKKPTTDDYVAVEEDNMMMVMSRTAAIQVELKQTISDKGRVEKQLKLAETERNNLLSKLVASENALSLTCRENEQLSEQLAVANDRISQLEKEREGLTSMHDSLRDKLDAITTEKTAMEKRLLEKDEYIASLQEKRKALISEKDALTGRNKSLEQEKELFKNHFTSTESNVQKYQTLVEEQRVQIVDAEETVRVLTDEVQHLQETLVEEQPKIEAANNAKATDQVIILELKDTIKNAEDKLLASDAMVTMLKEETLAQSQVISKMSSDLEGVKSEEFNLQTALTYQEKSQKAEKTKWLDEKAELQADMKATEKKLGELVAKVEMLSEQAVMAEGRTEEEQGSLYALQTAQVSLRERYSKMKAEYTEMKKTNETLHKRLKHHQQQESDLRREVMDLKERLTMGAEEYKIKYLEARKLEMEIRRLMKQLKRSVLPNGPSEDSSTETEQVQRSSSTSQTASMTSQTLPPKMAKVQTAEAGTLSCVVTSDVGTLTRQVVSDVGTSTTRWPGLAVPMPPSPVVSATPANPKTVDDLLKEVALRKSKQQKYKQLYHDEKLKINIIQQYHYGVIEKRDNELEEERSRHVKKVANLEDRLVKQEMIIDRQKAHIEQIREQQVFVDPSPVQVPGVAPLRPLTPVPPVVSPPLQLASPPQFPYQAPPFPSPHQAEVDMMYPLQVPPYPDLPRISYPADIRPAYSYPPSPGAAPLAPAVPPPLRYGNPYEQHYPVAITYPPQSLSASAPWVPPPITRPSPAPPAAPSRPAPSHPGRPAEDENNNECRSAAASRQSVTTPHSSLQVDAGAAGAEEEPTPEQEARVETLLTPLPAPIQPTVLPSAKVAAVKCLNGHGNHQEGLNMFLEDDSSSDEDEGFPRLENAEQEEERFHDAEGEPQKVCPSCNMTFPNDFPQHVFEAHVDGHYGLACPMCSEQFVDVDHRQFEAHVQAHFPSW